MDKANKQNGSVLIIVLWILMIIAFLTGEYLVHNRNKAELALNAMERLKRQAVTASFLQLYRSSGWKIVQAGHKPSDWIGLTLNSVKFFVRVDSEGKRININTADEMTIRNEIRNICSDDNGLNHYEKRADELTDAILDWRDADNLVRLNGAEKTWYNDSKKLYTPANGRFKTITELLMVKGVNRNLFNGKLPKGWQNSDDLNEDDYQDRALQGKSSGEKSQKDKKIQEKNGLSLLGDFTVYPKSDRRISIRILSENYHVYSEVLIFDKNMKKQEHIYNFYYGE